MSRKVIHTPLYSLNLHLVYDIDMDTKKLQLDFAWTAALVSQSNAAHRESNL